MTSETEPPRPAGNALPPRRLGRASSLLIGGQASSQLIGTVRNIVAARFLSPSDFGIAAALTMTLSIVEMLSDMGIGRNLTRQTDGDGNHRLAVAHAVSLVRGTVGAAALAVLGPLIAASIGMREQKWAFSLLGVVPLLRGIGHGYAWTSQRDLRFGPAMLIEVVPQAFSLVVVVPLLLWLGDFRALLLALLASSMTGSLLSHWVARTPYKVAWDPVVIREFRHFGWPLIIDGVVVMIMYHGERWLVARNFGAAWLGIYSAAYLLTWTPNQLFARLAFAIKIPILSGSGNRANASSITVLSTRLLTVTFGLGVLVSWLLGAQILTSVFGARYAIGADVLVVLGLTQLFRTMRTAPTCLALAKGDTWPPLLANCIRAAGVFGSAALIWNGASLVQALGFGVVSEFGATVFMHWQMFRKFDTPAVTPALLAAAVGTGALFAAHAMGVRGDAFSVPIRLAIVAAGLTVALPVLYAGIRNLHSALRHYGRKSPADRDSITGLVVCP